MTFAIKMAGLAAVAGAVALVLSSSGRAGSSAGGASSGSDDRIGNPAIGKDPGHAGHGTPLTARPGDQLAIFAQGCFWGVEERFRRVPGVVATAVGYAGGHTANPDYEEVCTDQTGHAESVLVEFDPTVVSYRDLLRFFFASHDPTSGNAQGPDHGTQYRSAIFTFNPGQQQDAMAARDEAQKSLANPITTEIAPAGPFWIAESYHQQWDEKHGARSCPLPHRPRLKEGAAPLDASIHASNAAPSAAPAATTVGTPNVGVATNGPAGTFAFKKPSEEELKKKLTPLQFEVTQEEGTERPFNNTYWDNHEPGIYVDVVSGEPLFSSLDKFESGTGWPSFTRPLEPANVVVRSDNSLMMSRTEVRSKSADSHLGHVFDDGPAPTGLRYCMNSASMRFIPVNKLAEEGYGKYLPLFGHATGKP